MTAPIHATLVAAWRDGGWSGVLLRGASGAGKSALALRLMRAGWRLVADDRVIVWASGGRLYGRAPPTLTGLVEARGVGVVPTPVLPWARIGLAADLIARDAVDRTPDPQTTELAGIRLPVVRLWADESACEAKLALALGAAFPCDATSPWTPAPTGVSSWRAEGPETAAANGDLL